MGAIRLPRVTAGVTRPGLAGFGRLASGWLFKPFERTPERIGLVAAMAIILIVASVQTASAQDPWRGVRPQILNEQQFSDFFVIVKAIQEANIVISPPPGASTDQEVAAISENAAAVNILEKIGYTPGEFVPMSVNVVMAHVAAENPDTIEDLNAALTKLEADKATMEAQQYQSKLSELTMRQNFLMSVPVENIALAKQFSDAMKALTTEGATQ